MDEAAQFTEMFAQCEPARELIVYYLGGSWGAGSLRDTCRACRALVPIREKISERAMISRAVRECNIPLINYMRCWGGSNGFAVFLVAIEESAIETVNLLVNFICDCCLHFDQFEFEESVDMPCDEIVNALLKTSNVDIYRIVLQTMCDARLYLHYSYCIEQLRLRSKDADIVKVVEDVFNT
jgi:hypothetical protein